MTATQAPTPGPLSGDDVKLLVKGDLLRVIEAGSFLLGRGLVDGGFATVRSVDGPYIDVYGPVERSDNRASRFAFIGRPDADGWMPWSGGENPVPGRIAETKHRGGIVYEGSEAWPSDEWFDGPGFWVHDGSDSDIIAFRLAPTAPVEASGSEREDAFNGDDAALVASITALLDLTDSALSHRVPCLAKQLLASAASRLSLRPQPSGETREAVARMTKALDAHPENNSVCIFSDDLRALIRPAPVATGGQHSGGEGGQ